MITARPQPARAPFAARLAAKARRIAAAHIEARRDEDRWRKPRLLWPLFGDR